MTNHMPANDVVGWRVTLVHRLEIEAGPTNDIAVHAKDNHAAHPMRLPVSTRAAHLPLGPDVVRLDGESNHLDVDVRNKREDLLPIPAHLRPPVETTGWMYRSLVLVVLGETLHQCLEVVLVGRAHESIDRQRRPLHLF